MLSTRFRPRLLPLCASALQRRLATAHGSTRRNMPKILCVAEKPSIAKAVAGHLSGGQMRAIKARGCEYTYNYEFTYDFGSRWGHCNVVMTSVVGHLKTLEFQQPNHKSWTGCEPKDLFDARVDQEVYKDKKSIAKNIADQAKYCKALYIWTDCDREGEHIGTEIRFEAYKGNARIEVKRARFSNIERAHVLAAARRPIDLDERQAQAVEARMELDLRIGAAFTRLQTMQLRPVIARVHGDKEIISYGSCQFPTLGFVVDRYFRVRNFVPEPFWNIKVSHVKDGIKVNFNWKRGHLFDRMAVAVIYERCLAAKLARVSKMQKKPTSKWKPLPLTTVELQKMGSRFLRMDSQAVMKAAESLYTKGWISYPRTETDQFDRAIDLKKIIEKQQPDGDWGGFAQLLMNGGFSQPRSGRNNDHAHPPIHPVNYTTRQALGNEHEKRVYEFVVRRFLACCSVDAKGEATDIDIAYGSEAFTAHGLRVLERNYLDVYPYDKWESSQQLPQYEVGEQFEPDEALMGEGKTSPPGYLTEPELIALMDANGIGTDATMAEHIAKIKSRSYVMTRSRGGGGGQRGGGEEGVHVGGRSGRGGRGGRGRGGRGGATATARTGSGGGGNEELIPSTLGVALIAGYDEYGFETSLSKPFLRKQMEEQMRAICAGTMTKNDVVQASIHQYRDVFTRTNGNLGLLKNALRKYVLNEAVQGVAVQQRTR
ncbi:DNA topoisomerase 3-beta [Phyllosticta citrichinensis]|uniref:DNA topoisomerase n=1 Tax=Phyllosticta citrichinensis TaxID=1130410 RepID=A0ABR1XGC1_9PEZI